LVRTIAFISEPNGVTSWVLELEDVFRLQTVIRPCRPLHRSALLAGNHAPVVLSAIARSELIAAFAGFTRIRIKVRAAIHTVRLRVGRSLGVRLSGVRQDWHQTHGKAGTIQALEHCGVDLYLDQQSIDTTTPAGRLMFQVTGAFAEFERSMIRQRVRAGLKRARDEGKRLGRPKVSPVIEKRIQSQLRAKKGILAIARDCRVGTGTVQRIAREIAEVSRPLDGASAAA
jgi:hypothetical protein